MPKELYLTPAELAKIEAWRESTAAAIKSMQPSPRVDYDMTSHDADEAVTEDARPERSGAPIAPEGYDYKAAIERWWPSRDR
jgi:hypothetical protein